MTSIVYPVNVVDSPTRDSAFRLGTSSNLGVCVMLNGSSSAVKGNVFEDWDAHANGVDLQWEVFQQLEPLEAQAGGHKFEEKETSKGAFIGCLQSKKMGTVLKRLQEAVRGERELNFYKSVFLEENVSDSYQDILQLRSFLPAFYGMIKMGSSSYIMLSDLTRGFHRPCVIDVKMGTQTYDPNADVVKRNREAKKYCNIKDLGFCVTAYRIYDQLKNYYRLIEDEDGKNHWRQLKRDHMRTEFLRLLPAAPQRRRQIVEACIRRLRLLRQWFRRQRLFSFYSSSILIVYDGVFEDALSSPDSATDDSGVSCGHDDFADDHVDHAESERKLSTDVNSTRNSDGVVSGGDLLEDDATAPAVRLHMIDFAHAYRQSEIGVVSDEGYLVGLDNLIEQFQSYTPETS